MMPAYAIPIAAELAKGPARAPFEARVDDECGRSRCTLAGLDVEGDAADDLGRAEILAQLRELQGEAYRPAPELRARAS